MGFHHRRRAAFPRQLELVIDAAEQFRQLGINVDFVLLLDETLPSSPRAFRHQVRGT